MGLWGKRDDGIKWGLAGSLGKSSKLTISLARISLALACLIECLMTPRPTIIPHHLECALFASYVTWAMLCPWITALSWKTDVRTWPILLITDWLVCIAITLLFEAYVIPVLLFSVLLLSAFHIRFGTQITLVAALGLSLAFAFRSVIGPTAVPTPPSLLPSLALSVATILIAGFVAISLVSARAYRATLKSWGDELLIVGGNFKALPIEFLLSKLSELFRAEQIAFVWRESDDDAVHMTLREGGDAAITTLANSDTKMLLDPQICEGAFMFDPHADALLCMGRKGHPRAIEARALTELIARNFTPGRGQSFPIRIGEMTARVYIMGRLRISEDGLRECERAGDLTEAVFERYLFLRAWRDRSFVDARHSLSRDLHDSVLQTLAGLRMQIASILGRKSNARDDVEVRQLENMQSVIVAEQARLRQILDESYRAASESANLSMRLEECAASLSRQWSIECRFCADEGDIVVDSNTAVEVEFLVREAVANAAQHARAKRIALVVAFNEGSLFISLRNDSPHHRGRIKSEIQPSIDIDSRSLIRRLTTLGGSAYSEDIGAGSLLAMRIPLARGMTWPGS